MTYIASRNSSHPGLPKNDLGYTHRDYEGRFRRCAPAAGMTRSPVDHRGLFHLSIEPHPRRQDSGIGMFSKTPDYFSAIRRLQSVHGRMPRC